MVRRVLYSLFIFGCISLKTPLAWGFSVERMQNYQLQAQNKLLAQDGQWLRLGHYKKNFFGGYRSKIRGDFFLSENGARDPAAELDQTIAKFFTSPLTQSSSLQCRYLARVQWLRTQLDIHPDDLVRCPERDAWKQKFNASEVYLVFAANDLNSAPSSFGHTFLRFHNAQNQGSLELLDYGVNFAAETGEADGIMFALKGLFGMYPGSYSMMPFHQKMREYTNIEGRDIWEYKMNFQPAQIELMLNHLLELAGTYVPYFFVDDNCSYQILELIEIGRPDLDLTSHFKDVTIPLDTLKILGQQKGFLSEERLRPSLMADFQASYNKLNSQQTEELNGLLQIVKKNSVPAVSFEKKADERKQFRAEVLNAALNYLAIKEYRDQSDFKAWKYQLAVERATLGLGEASPPEEKESPLSSSGSAAIYLGYGQDQYRNFGQFKLRRAFHDLISRDAGVSPFSHVEALGVEIRYFSETKGLDLDNIQLMKIISTQPVTRLDRPISWKTSLGTEYKLAPFLEGGLGYSFDFNGGLQSRWIQLLESRVYMGQDGRTYLGMGPESVFVEKFSAKFRSLQSFQYLGVLGQKPFVRAEFAFSYDVTPKIEARISYDKRSDRDIYLLSLIF